MTSPRYSTKEKAAYRHFRLILPTQEPHFDHPGNRVRITHASSAHPWTDNRVHFRECGSLASAGYDVTLVAIESKISDVKPRVRVLAASAIAGRSKRALLGSIRAIMMAVRTHPRVVHLHDPELSWAIPLLRLVGKHVIYDAHEDLPNQLVNKTYIKPAFRKLARGFGHVIVALTRSASHVIAATETIAERYPANKVTIVHNYPPASVTAASRSPIDDRESIALYIGGMSELRGLSQMLDATHEDAWPSTWTLLLAGPIPEHFRTQIEDSRIHPRVQYLGHVPPDDARRLLDKAKVGFCLFQDTQSHRDALPTKIFEYIEAGLPVIASDFPLWRNLFHTCGTLVDQASSSAIARAVAAYDVSPELLTTHSTGAVELSARFTWEHEAQQLLQVYKDLVGNQLPRN